MDTLLFGFHSWLAPTLSLLSVKVLPAGSLVTGQLHALSENRTVQTPANLSVLLQCKLGSGMHNLN